LRNFVVIEADSMNRFFVIGRTISIPKNAEVLIFTLHAFYFPVINFFNRIICLSKIRSIYSPIP
jgi:hypothetical protein